MKTGHRIRPRVRTRAVLLRTLILLGGFVLVANLGYLLAVALRPGSSAELMRTAIEGDAYLSNTALYLALRSPALGLSFAIAMLVFIGIAVVHYFAVGAVDMTAGRQQDPIAWYGLTERVVHWLVAVTFVLLLISGLAVTFGRMFDGGAFTRFLVSVHNWSGVAFTPLLVVMLGMWLVTAAPRAYDWRWWSRLGGYLGGSKEGLTAGKFNAGQKGWFWLAVLAGLVLVVTGLGQFLRLGDLAVQRLLVAGHVIASIPVVLGFLVHLYLTTAGTRGAFMKMVDGKIGRAAAEQFNPEAKELRRAAAERASTPP